MASLLVWDALGAFPPEWVEQQGRACQECSLDAEGVNQILLLHPSIAISKPVCESEPWRMFYWATVSEKVPIVIKFATRRRPVFMQASISALGLFILSGGTRFRNRVCRWFVFSLARPSRDLPHRFTWAVNSRRAHELAIGPELVVLIRWRSVGAVREDLVFASGVRGILFWRSSSQPVRFSTDAHLQVRGPSEVCFS